jgi:hypothetical protein
VANFFTDFDGAMNYLAVDFLQTPVSLIRIAVAYKLW